MENTKSQKKSYSTASSKSRARRKTKTDYYDYSLVAVIVLLTCFGLIMLYSTSSYMAQINYGSDMYFFKKQAIISVACIIMALIISRLNYRILNRFSTALYVAALVLMALVKTPLGQSSHGAQRWLNLGPVQFPAGRACQDSSYCLPPIYDRAYGKESPYLKGLYGSCCCGRRTGTGCICIYGQSEYSNYYFLYYCRTDFCGSPGY